MDFLADTFPNEFRLLQAKWASSSSQQGENNNTTTTESIWKLSLLRQSQRYCRSNVSSLQAAEGGQTLAHHSQPPVEEQEVLTARRRASNGQEEEGHAEAKWLSAAASTSAQRLEAITDILLGKKEGGGGGGGGGGGSTEGPLTTVLREKSLVAASNGKTSANSVTDTPQKYENSDDYDQGTQRITSEALAFCMLSARRQQRVLFEAAILSTLRGGGGVDFVPLNDSQFIQDVLEFALLLTQADCSQAYVYPASSKAHTKLIKSLAYVGLLYPLQVKEPVLERLFVVPRSYKEATTCANSNGGSGGGAIRRSLRLAHHYSGVKRREREEEEEEGRESKKEPEEEEDQQATEPCLARKRRLQNFGINNNSNEKSSNGNGAGVGAGGGIAGAALDCIITETNFRLYVYLASSAPPPSLTATQVPPPETEGAAAAAPPTTSSSFTPSARTLLTILNQFAEKEVEVPPTFAVYRLTREAFFRAMRVGISAEQIMDFLASKAHPVMVSAAAAKSSSVITKSSSILPAAICDQFRMWSKEAERVKFSDEDFVLLTMPSPAATKRALAWLTARLAATTSSSSTPAATAAYEGHQQLVLSRRVFVEHVKPFLLSTMKQ